MLHVSEYVSELTYRRHHISNP